MGTMTLTGADINLDGNPNLLQQPQIDLATTTVTGVDMNGDGLPDVLRQLQCGLAPQGFAAPAWYGAPVNMGTMTVTGADMNRDGNPNVLQQPQSGLPTMTVTQGDHTMEEREELEDQLVAVRDELLDRDEDPELVDLVYNFWNGCTTPIRRNSPMMLGQPSLSFTTSGAALDTSISRSTTAMRERITASLLSSTALQSGAGTGVGPHAEEVLELVPPPGARKTYQGV